MKYLKIFNCFSLIILLASSVFAQESDIKIIRDYNILIDGWIREFEVSKSNPDIIFAVDGKVNVSSSVYKTSNGGETWDKVKGFSQFSMMAIDPVNPDVVFGVPGG